MIVMKFGGTSNEDAAAMRNVIRIVNAHRSHQPVVVISAIARATNELEQIARTASLGEKELAAELIESLIRRHLVIVRDLITDPERKRFLDGIIAGYRTELFSRATNAPTRQIPDPRLMDAVCSFGERLSSRIVASALEESGTASSWVDVKDFMLTDDNFGRARPVAEQVRQNLRTVVHPLLKDGKVPVTQGFIGITSGGEYTTMGRESSDYSATIIGALLPARKVQIWTDVDGILTADPRLVPSVCKVRRMSFGEALHLSRAGAKVLHPTTMIPVLEKEIPVQILNSKRENGSGTLVEVAPLKARGFAKSIAHRRNMAVLRFTGPDGAFISRVLPALSSKGIPPHLVSMAGDSALVLLERQSVEDRLLDELKRYGATEVFADKSSITIVGEGISTLAGRISALLAEGGLMMMSGPASSASLTFVIDTKHLEPLILKLHRALIEESPDPELFDPVGS